MKPLAIALGLCSIGLPGAAGVRAQARGERTRGEFTETFCGIPTS